MSEADASPKSWKSLFQLDNLFINKSEKTFEESALVEDTQFKPYNSDDLYQLRNDYSIYEEMLQDEQVNVAMQLKKDLILASGYEIVSEEEGQEEIEADIERALGEDLDVPFEDYIEEVLSAFDFGFSLTEKIFKNRDDGSLTLSTLKTRHPATWLIWTDDQGNIQRYQQFETVQEITVDPRSLIHYVNRRKFQNPYGTSDLRSAYQAWFAKKQIWKFYLIFMEKAASPIPIASYKKNTKEAAVTKVFNTIKKFQTKTAMAIPDDIVIDWLQANGEGQVYLKALDLMNMFIGRSLFIPDLMGFQGSETSGGSFSLGENQIEMALKHIERRRKTVEHLINSHIIKPIVFFNHGFVEHFPKFQFRQIQGDDTIKFAETFLKAMQSRTYKPTPEEINHFRGLIKFPESDDVEISEPQPQGGLNEPGQINDNGDNVEPNPSTPVSGSPSDAVDQSDEVSEQKDQFALKPFKNPEGDFHKRVDFQAVETQLDQNKNQILSETDPVVRAIIADVQDQIQKKKIIERKDFDRIDTIKIKKLSQLKQILNKNMRDLFKDAKQAAGKEIIKQEFDTVLPSDVFLQAIDNENFNYVGDWEFNFSREVRNQLSEAIKSGKPLNQVLSSIEEEGKRLSDVSIERYARTKSTEVLNRARLEFFNESQIVDAYQYSAILDGRTTDICRGLHGKIFKNGTEPVPPMHFNCRSILIPVTIFEEKKFDESINVNKETLSPLKSKTNNSKEISLGEFIDKKAGKGFKF